MSKRMGRGARRLSGWLAGVLALTVIAGQAANALETVTYFHNDVAGTPLVATDAAGEVVWKESYRPYGERLVNSPASGDNGVWYAGKPQDEAAGLSYRPFGHLTTGDIITSNICRWQHGKNQEIVHALPGWKRRNW